MKNMPCLKEFIKYSSLNVFGMIALSCYILADTYFVAKGLGANGLTALNLAIPFYSFIHGLGLMIGMGGATKYSILQSQRAVKNEVFSNAIILVIIFSSIFFIIGLFLSDTIIRLLGANEAVFEMSKTYLQVILLFAPMFILNNVLLCFIRNDGAPQLAMKAMIGGSLSNVILDYIFIFPCQMGIFGAVLATGLAPIISMFILLPFFYKKKNNFHLFRCKVTKSISYSIFSSGFPSFITEFSSGIVIIIFNIIILRLQGNTGVAAYGVIANLSLVVIAIYTGIAQGIQPLISTNHGAGSHKNVQIIFLYALISMLVISILVYFTVFFGANHIVNIFNSEQNLHLQKIAENGLKIYFTACLFAGFNIIISVYFTSIEYARPAHLIAVLRGFVIIVPMAFILSSVAAMTGIWLAFPATEFIVSAIALILYIQDKKAK